MYGTQTIIKNERLKRWFENDVKMYGTQTNPCSTNLCCGFENDVKMYGTQTDKTIVLASKGLRMM